MFLKWIYFQSYKCYRDDQDKIWGQEGMQLQKEQILCCSEFVYMTNLNTLLIILTCEFRYEFPATDSLLPVNSC